VRNEGLNKSFIYPPPNLPREGAKPHPEKENLEKRTTKFDVFPGLILANFECLVVIC
jgi:hypothetical protein